MKTIFFTIAVTATIISGTIFTGCKSTAQEEDVKAPDQEQSLYVIHQAPIEEWKAFKSESEIKIADNEKRIAELKVSISKKGKTLDGLYEKKIENLEQKNKDIKMRIDTYEKSHSNWAEFKSELNHDMDELGKSLKDFTIDNKK